MKTLEMMKDRLIGTFTEFELSCTNEGPSEGVMTDSSSLERELFMSVPTPSTTAIFIGISLPSESPQTSAVRSENGRAHPLCLRGATEKAFATVFFVILSFAVFALGGCGNGSSAGSSGGNTKTVPDVVGETQSAATSAITSGGLVLGTVTQQANSTVAAGDVVSQSPTAGASVANGSAVNLVVSSGGQPSVTLSTPTTGASQLSGHAYDVDPSKIKVVIYVLTNEWYVQPTAAAPFTNITSDGSWTSATNPWTNIVVLLVDPSSYAPTATKITNPALDPGVLASTQYPAVPASVNFSGYTWAIKLTGSHAGDQFDPGPNFWSSDPSVVSVASDGLHLKINQIGGSWQCGEVSLTKSLGYGTYTVQVNARLDQLDKNTVAAPLFIYAAPSQELDNEYSGPGGLIPSPNNAQFVVQPYTVTGNLIRYFQPPTAQFTTQMEWQADHVTFISWNGWSTNPASGEIIYQWTYSGAYIPPPGQEHVHISLWLLNGNAPTSGSGNEMVIHSFAFDSGATTVSVPNVVGQTQAAATSAITGAGLVVGAVKQQSSTTVAAGNVISESPAAGTSVAQGSTVNLVVSSGRPPVSVPNAVGQTQAAATSAITGAGLIVGAVTQQSSNTVAAGTVISQGPAAGTSVPQGSAVNLVVSSGPPPVSVPNVVGQTQAAATSAITGAGLIVGAVTQQSSNTVAAGTVISQGPTAGTSVPQGSAVNLTISTGPAGAPSVTLDTPALGASQLSGHAYNVDPSKIKVVIYVLTNQWYVQPFAATPFTNIASDGSWASFTHPWNSIVVLLVDPSNYTPAATEITNPALDPGVLASTQYPAAPASIDFSGYTWAMKVTGNQAGDQFDPGPNFWSSDPSVIHTASDGLHLKINQIGGLWQCAEVSLNKSLGYGTYTVQVASRLDQLDLNTVAAPLFIYAAPGQELDNEYSGSGGLIPSSNNAQFVVQPYTVAGNLFRYLQPSTAQFTTQMEWQSDHVTFTSWNGWAATPVGGSIIYQWTYTGSYIPPPGQERVHINLWLLSGNAPTSGNGNEMIIHSFNFHP